MDKTYSSVLVSPIGNITIMANDEAIHTITFSTRDTAALNSNDLTENASMQLQNYFDGKIQDFSFPMVQIGTEFQQAVWEGLTKINYGNTISYLKFSQQLNNPLAIRAIAAANGKNNIAIVVPCHRVIGSDGKLVGYAGELWRKQWLLEHERRISGKGQSMLQF